MRRVPECQRSCVNRNSDNGVWFLTCVKLSWPIVVAPVSFSPAALGARSISVFPPGARKFDIPLPLMTRAFEYGQSGRSVGATAVKENRPKTFNFQLGIFKIELEPARATTIPSLDAFYSIDCFRFRRARI
jgi:hypothetical protein